VEESTIYQSDMRNRGFATFPHVVLTTDGEIFDTSCHILETANFRDYISYLNGQYRLEPGERMLRTHP